MAKKSQPVPKSFEEGMRELETILADMENGQIGLEESLTRYERGAFLIQHCRTVLSAAQTQIEQLTRSPDGEPRLAPLPDDTKATDSVA
jgi:exodeoxyribonuclease VII small subunit